MNLRIPELTLASHGIPTTPDQPRIAVDKVKFSSITDEFIHCDDNSRNALNYFFALQEIWQLSGKEQENLLRDNSLSYPIQANTNMRICQETQKRIGLLLEIYGLLHQLYGSNSAAANRWVKKSPSARLFEGKSAIEIMSKSDSHLQAVADFIHQKVERTS